MNLPLARSWFACGWIAAGGLLGGLAAATMASDRPVPLPDHPGHIFLEHDEVAFPIPASIPAAVRGWRLWDDRHQLVREGAIGGEKDGGRASVALGPLAVGWYRMEFAGGAADAPAFTTVAVLPAWRGPRPVDSPIAVDSATAWFARQDVPHQRSLANLAALAGVGWVRDRLAWSEIQPEAGALKPTSTTYDTAAEEQQRAGLQVLQVFHDTPAWARGSNGPSGHFPADLRHAHALGKALAGRFRGRVQAWEPWNEANITTFGGHTVDEMCSWQKAAWWGFKAGDPELLVGWNVTAMVPSPWHTEGVLANETWPYYDTYNIHTYDWPSSYAELWKSALAAAAGRPIWVTEADRGTPHLKNPPWFDQDPRLEILKAEFMAQSYASSLWAGARRHFHFILGNYQEPNGVQFGLLRQDLTPRPAYVALAAVGRCLAQARAWGRWLPVEGLQVYAFRARPDGIERDVLVVWAERPVDWPERGRARIEWAGLAGLKPAEVVDYLGRSRGTTLPAQWEGAPTFVILPAGTAAHLPWEKPPTPAAWRAGEASPTVLQFLPDDRRTQRVEDVPWSEGHAWAVRVGKPLAFHLNVYQFGAEAARGRVVLARQPEGWIVRLDEAAFAVDPLGRVQLRGTLEVPAPALVRGGWVVWRAETEGSGQPALAVGIKVEP